MKRTARRVQNEKLIYIVIASTLVVFLISVVRSLNHILEWVAFACKLGQVALAGSLCVVAAISEHAA